MSPLLTTNCLVNNSFRGHSTTNSTKNLDDRAAIKSSTGLCLTATMDTYWDNGYLDTATSHRWSMTTSTVVIDTEVKLDMFQIQP